MFELSRCPICGMLHDDGSYPIIDGARVFLCMDCSDDAPRDKDERTERIKRKIAENPEKMFAPL